MPLLTDPKFVRDREDFGGRSWKKEDIERARPEAVAEIRDGFAFLEEGLLADGRQWILGGDQPSAADIEGDAPSSLLTRELAADDSRL